MGRRRVDNPTPAGERGSAGLGREGVGEGSDKLRRWEVTERWLLEGTGGALSRGANADHRVEDVSGYNDFGEGRRV